MPYGRKLTQLSEHHRRTTFGLEIEAFSYQGQQEALFPLNA